eukprot:TRINITY_DN25188_c0_g1_i1.p1 TRINITY_DN25188_c0_g1~~TRINITY_DN25188_c0_g1_i1.p1  ORF type:complete len:353 (+),score=75.20 TRINITY_DN25188_c0_g1_i1:50-1108(+)
MGAEGKRKYNPNEIIVMEHGCKDVETLESPYTETGKGGQVVLRDKPKITILRQWRDETRSDVGQKEDEIDFEVEDISPAVANLYRRTMMMDVATMAIDVVLIHENDGAVFDEALSHRLGLVPLDVDADQFSYTVGDINTASPDPKSVLRFVLDVKADRDNYQVYSSDIKYTPLEDAPSLPTEPKPVHKKIMLAKLMKGSRIKLTLFAIKGKGSQHAKWSPAGCVTYKPLPIVRVSKKVKGEEARYLKKRCPGEVFDIEDSGALVAARPKQCTMCRECIRSDLPMGAGNVELGLHKHGFEFHVESVGVYRAAQLLPRAMNAFSSHLRHLSNEAKHAWPTTFTESTDPSKEDYL